MLQYVLVFPMNSPRETYSLAEELNALSDLWFNRQTSQTADAIAAYTVLLEAVNAYKLSEPQITNVLTPRLGLTKAGRITDAEGLGRLVVQRLTSIQEGDAPGHYEVDNALRCALAIAKDGDLISELPEQQVKDAIKAPIAHLTERQ